jgi:hypothetical protein
LPRRLSSADHTSQSRQPPPPHHHQRAKQLEPSLRNTLIASRWRTTPNASPVR